jgi:hypothetical protein
VLGWLRVLSEWVGSSGTVTGTDVDGAALAAAGTFVTEERLGTVRLVNDDLFASRLETSSFDLIHARFKLTPLGFVAVQPAGSCAGATGRAERRGVPSLG